MSTRTKHARFWTAATNQCVYENVWFCILAGSVCECLVKKRNMCKRSLAEVSDDNEWFTPLGFIRTKDGEPPRFWPTGKINKKGKLMYKTNVVHGCFNATKNHWEASCLVEGKQCKRTHHSVFKHKTMEAAFASMCATRRGVVDTSSTVPSVMLIDPTTKTFVVDKCTHNTCRRTNVHIAAFAPDPRKTLDQFEEFGVAMAIVSDPDATAEDRAASTDALKELRTLWCFDCREAHNRSRNTGDNCLYAACKAAAEDIRADLATRPCAKCGKLCGRAMQCDHRDRLDKIFAVLQYADWATPDLGPDAMWTEYRKTVPLCTVCHLLEPTHDKYRGADSNEMLSTTKKEKDAKLRREYLEQKAEINAGWKANRCCFHCGRKVKPGQEHAFPWMHSHKKMVTDRVAIGLPPLRKRYTISMLQGSGICPATFVRLAKPEIDAKCELGCANCHMIYETLPELAVQKGRLKQFVAEWAERGGVVVV